MNSSFEPIALRVPDAAAAIGISRSLMYELLKDRSIPSLKIGGRRVILREELDAFLSRQAEITGL